MGDSSLSLVHFIEVGDGHPPEKPVDATARLSERGIEVTVADRKYLFTRQAPFAVTQSE